MKSKKQKVNTNSNTKKNNKTTDSATPMHKQFQLIYRTCDRLPSSQQYQSVLFLKRKKITNEDHSAAHQTKTKKKKPSSKKKKIEEKPHLNEKMNATYGKSETLCLTKSTMPSTTTGFLKKSTFADTFKQKIDLEKSSIRKVNNLSNSNSSRYLSSKNLIKQQKSPSKKITSPTNKNLKSPTNKNQPQKAPIQSSNKSIDQNLASTHRIKNIKSKNQKNDQIRENEKITDSQYAFIDGEYMEIDKPSSKILTNKIISQRAVNSESNEFIRSYQRFKSNFEEKVSNERKTQVKESIASQYQISLQQYLKKVITIQRWWRSYVQKKKVDECNNIKHFPSVVQSERSNPSPRNEHEQHIENEDQNHQETPRKQEGLLNFIKTKQNLILNHMQSQKQILNKMLELNKIDLIKYSQSLMEVQSNYQKEINSINKLKLKIEAENQKMNQLKMKIKQKSDILNKLEKIPTNVILQNFFNTSVVQQSDSQKIISSQKPIYQRQKSTGCHYSIPNEAEKSENSYKTISYKKTQTRQISSPEEQQTSNQQVEQEQAEEQQEENDENSDEIKITTQILELYADRQLAQAQIQKRYANQLGIGATHLNGVNKNLVSTSVLGIHNFLMNFLKFYEYFYKDEFLKMINLPYGYNQKTRIKILQGYNAQKWQKEKENEDNDDQIFFQVTSIIGDQILDDFHEHNYHLPDNIDDVTKAAIYFEKIHQRAVIDCFNEALSSFRPYYFINGAPYSWNYSEKALTFYYIAEQNIQQVFEKTQYKVLKNASCLCGTIVQGLMKNPQITPEMTFQQQFSKYRESVSPALIETREQKLGKIEKQELEQNNYRWENYEEQKTQTLFNLAQFVMTTLLDELLELKPLGQSSVQNLYLAKQRKSTMQQTEQSQSHSEQQSQQEQSRKQSSSNQNNIKSTNQVEGQGQGQGQAQGQGQEQEQEQDQKQQQNQASQQQQREQNEQNQQDQESQQQQKEVGQQNSQNNSTPNNTHKKIDVQPIQFNDGQDQYEQGQQRQQCELSARERRQYYQGEQQQGSQQNGLQYEQQENQSQNQ